MSVLQLLRRQVVQAVHAWMTQIEAAATFGASLRAVSRWMGLERAGGLRDLKLKRRGRRPGAGRLPGKADAAHSGEGDRPDARVEGHPVHRSGEVRRFVEQHRQRLIWMPCQHRFNLSPFRRFKMSHLCRC